MVERRDQVLIGRFVVAGAGLVDFRHQVVVDEGTFLD
jgi:hypothetical protein